MIGGERAISYLVYDSIGYNNYYKVEIVCDELDS